MVMVAEGGDIRMGEYDVLFSARCCMRETGVFI